MTDLIRSDRVRFGPYEADLHTHELWKFGTRVKLVGQPFAILREMLARPGELVTRDELRERLWPGETFVDFNHGLNAAVNKLRDVLCDSAEDPKYIETLPRRGYRFIAAVERPVQTKEVEELSAIEETPAVPVVYTAPEPPKKLRLQRSTPRKTFYWTMWVAGWIVTCVFVFGLFLTVLKVSKGWAERQERGKHGEIAMTGPLKGAQVVLVTGGRNEGPQFSPDGMRLVFMSDRSGGGTDLWIANANGSEPRRLTTLKSAGTPRWSPDGTKIAFDSELNGRTVILVVNASGGQPALAVANDSNNRVPSWSRDGRYLYFASDRTGRYEVWKMPADGGAALQVTSQGGFSALESPDGKTIYYAKNQFDHPEVWRVPVEGGEETLASVAIHPGTWASWTIAGNGIYFVEEAPGNVAMLSVFDLQTQRLRQLTLMGRFPFWLAMSADGSKAVFDRVDSETTTSIVELEDFQ